MPTDTALLAQLQSLWQAVPPPGPEGAPLPAVLIDRPPEPSPASTPTTPVGDHGEENDGNQGRLDDQWVLAENAAGQVGIDRANVPLERRWWRWATFDHLPYGDGRLPVQAEPPDGDPFDDESVLDDQARQYLVGRHRYPERCGFCGGCYRHHPRCVALCDEWAVAMPFGKNKGKPVASLDHDYLRWVLTTGMELNAELRREIERALKIEQDA